MFQFGSTARSRAEEVVLRLLFLELSTYFKSGKLNRLPASSRASGMYGVCWSSVRRERRADAA